MRLRKYVVTDEVTETVPVKREEIRVEREPFTDANVDDALDGAEFRGRAQGRAPRGGGRSREARRAEERVRLDKDVEVDERTVSEDVRREEIDIDDSGRRGNG